MGSPYVNFLFRVLGGVAIAAVGSESSNLHGCSSNTGVDGPGTLLITHLDAEGKRDASTLKEKGNPLPTVKVKPEFGGYWPGPEVIIAVGGLRRLLTDTA